LPPRRRPRRLLLKTVLVLVVLVAVTMSLWTWFAMSYKYSTGERTGYVRNLTKNGWLCKTWEGEMTVAPVPGVPAQSFKFTMHSDSLAAIVQGAPQKQVTLTYSEHVALPSRCLGDTPFFVDGVRVAP